MEGILMKKLITVSILSAALAASSAFALGNDRGKGNGPSIGGNQGPSVEQIFLAKGVVNKKQSQDIANALFVIKNHLDNNPNVRLMSLNVEQDNHGMWAAVAKYSGNAEQISAEDLAAASKSANKQLGGETVTASKGMYFAFADLSSEDRADALVVKVAQSRNEFSVTQVASDDPTAKLLIKKIEGADHSKLEKIVAKEKGGR